MAFEVPAPCTFACSPAEVLRTSVSIASNAAVIRAASRARAPETAEPAETGDDDETALSICGDRAVGGDVVGTAGLLSW